MRYPIKVAFVAGVLFLIFGLVSPFVYGQTRQGVISGTVLDAETGEMVEYAQILLEEAGRSTASDMEGEFMLSNIPGGHYTLKVFRIGYEPLIHNVEIPAGDTLWVTLGMTTSALVAGEVIVEGRREQAQQLADAAMELEGRALRQKLGTTIAETLEEEPGIAMRSMGPAPARPVLRGLGGERLLVLEDGGRTGDLSGASTDHAVVIDPMTAERLEVVRGPAALIYGPNTLGGVINVVRDYVPVSHPGALHMEFSAQGQSVNQGYAAGASILSPLGHSFALHADGSFREAQNLHTPAGALKNTALSTLSTSLGASLVRPWGYAGLAGSYYNTDYGIPGGFVGAHPNGVRIEMDRRHLEARAEVLAPLPHIPRIEMRGTYSRYFHQEFESDGSLGIEFGLLSYHGTLIARTAQYGPFRKGAIGFWSEYRDYAAGGFSFTPASTEWTVAGFGFQDVHFGDLTLQGGLRYDLRRVMPRRERTSQVIGRIQERTFGGVSASFAALWHPVQTVTFGLTGMRSLRMPGIEELFSEGPHLAAYSFEVGNPNLEQESGYGVELIARYRETRFEASVAAYHNFINHYIFPLNTGELNYRVYLPIYQYTGAEARMWGGEAKVHWHFLPRWTLESSGSYVYGTLSDIGEPIPWMPPLTGIFGIRYQEGAFATGIDMRLAAPQKRLGPFEERTGGYATLNVFGQYYFTAGGLLHTIDLIVENATNTEYRDHLSRVKSIMPEAGRNIKLLYKVLF